MNTLDQPHPLISAAAVPLDLPAIRAALDVVARRLAGLLEAVPDPQAPTRGLAWTLGETSLHVAGGPARYADFARGRALPEPTIDLGPVFAQRMAAQPERAPGVLARQLEANTRRYLAETAELAATHPVPFFGGVTVELAAQSAILLGEFVVHGRDIARSIGRPWPIDPAHARLVMAAVTALLPRYVDRAAAAGLTATYHVHLRGGPSFQVRFDRGAATVGPPDPGAADCRLTVDPVTFMLVVYGRRSQWSGILPGRLRARGRRPWLGPRFQRLFVRP
ncbi:MAG TPA: maleylpyruvate isomerase family mycothiol-dependent enzyme [Actinomycetes bacterium]|nr:maleylpyruvate isomerase family mycothiol-dependent enzyme [Actinomycetes bacterium]